MNEINKLSITHSAEYKTYIAALCHLASSYVPEIRRQFASQAFEKYQNETIRSLVLAYGKEWEKLQESRLSDFELAANHPDWDCISLGDSCLNNARSYAEAIKFFFGI